MLADDLRVIQKAPDNHLVRTLTLGRFATKLPEFAISPLLANLRNDAAGELRRRLFPKLLRIARMHGIELYDAMLIVDETLDLLDSDKCDPTNNLEGWLRAACKNRSVSYLRKRSKWRQFAQVLPDGSETISSNQLQPSREESPDEFACRQEQTQQLHQVVQCLGELDKAILELRFWKGFPAQEIAKELKLSLPTVNSRLYRAVDRCRKLLRAGMGASPVSPVVRTGVRDCRAAFKTSG